MNLRKHEFYLQARQRERNYYYVLLSSVISCRTSYLLLPTPAKMMFGDDLTNEYLMERYQIHLKHLRRNVDAYYEVLNYYHLEDMLGTTARNTIRFLIYH